MGLFSKEKCEFCGKEAGMLGRKKLRDKNKCDYVIANDLANIRQGNHKALIIDKNDNITKSYGKEDIAKKLVKRLIKDIQL